MPRQLVFVNRYFVFVLLASALIAAALPASAAFDWDENVDGDLADTLFEPFVSGGTVGDYNVNAVPTHLGSTSVGTGVNTVEGSSDATAAASRFDAMTFEVLAGQTVTAINLVTVSSPASQTASINLTELTDAATDPDTYTLLSNTASFPIAPGSYDLLSFFGIGSLGPGTYGFDISSTFTSGNPTTYTLDVVVVPEPAVIALLAAGSLMMFRRRPTNR